ncbi:MAG: T9SS type A sorting domain-containing protein [candidate division WOR-3 bacterium]
MSQTNWSFVVSYSTNGGESWTRCNLSGTQSGFAHALAVATPQPNVVYAGGEVSGQSAVYYSTNNGMNWTRTAASPGDTVFEIAVDPGDADRVYAATPSGVFVTTNGGESWSVLPSGRGIRAVVVMPGGPDTLFCGGDSGVAVSRDRGRSWTAMNQGLAGGHVTCLGFGPGRLIAGTTSGACYAWEMVTSIGSGRPTAADGRELRVLPSPGRGMLTVLVPQGLGRVIRVRLMDVSGRQAMVIAPRPGALQIDSRVLAPGVYLVEVEAESGRVSSRAVVTR